MSVEKTIQGCLNFLIDANKETKEWVGKGFLDRSDFALLMPLTKRHYNQWTSKMSYSGWVILNKYKEHFDDHDVKVEDIERPDYIPEDKIKKTDLNIVNIINNKFKIVNPCDDLKNTFRKKENEIEIEFNLETLYKLLPFFQENKLRINKDYFKFINMYLNVLESDEMFVGFKNQLQNFKFKLKPFQAIGCLYMILNKRVILGDEMGLGKTIQAISSVEIAGKKPCLIICPNSLKYNWYHEIVKSLKNPNIQFLNKKSDSSSDYYIVNYESLHNYLDFIKELKPVSVILDESHYVKNQKTKRTKSCIQAINNIEYRFALTGTAILKSPIDLISQLKIINRLDYFGCENTFIEKFCGNSATQWGKDVRKGASNLNVLNKELRESCFIRREKKTVSRDLPEKTRTTIYLNSLSRNYKKYMEEFNKLSHRDKIDKLEKLRTLAAEDKLDSVKEWINNFQQTEKKLVVFAYHTKIQKNLVEAYPNASAITAGMTDKEKDNNVARFMNDDDCKIIICSLKAASVGLTLTAASDVLFAEIDWCAANNTQAEDRCHRIGQKNNVNIWYLISKGTIEEHIESVVSKKRNMFNELYQADLNLNDPSQNSSVMKEVIAELDNKNNVPILAEY